MRLKLLIITIWWDRLILTASEMCKNNIQLRKEQQRKITDAENARGQTCSYYVTCSSTGTLKENLLMRAVCSPVEIFSAITHVAAQRRFIV